MGNLNKDKQISVRLRAEDYRTLRASAQGKGQRASERARNILTEALHAELQAAQIEVVQR